MANNIKFRYNILNITASKQKQKQMKYYSFTFIRIRDSHRITTQNCQTHRQTDTHTHIFILE